MRDLRLTGVSLLLGVVGVAALSGDRLSLVGEEFASCCSMGIAKEANVSVPKFCFEKRFPAELS